jgi:PAS domain S-box-containing protein
MNRGRWQNIAATFSNVGVAPKNFSMDGFLFEPASPISPRLVQALVLVGLVVLVLALLFALWNHQMRHLVRAKTAELEAEVCQRKLMESDLRKSRARLDLILQSVGEGIQGLDAEGRITFQNAAATEMFGEKADDMVGGVAHTLVHHSRADGSPYPVSECPIYATLRDGQTRRVAEDVFFRLDGISFPVEYVCSPVRAENGLTEGVVVSFRDITEKKKLEAQFLRSQRMESIGTLAGGIAHDLNNVLAPILMSIQLLRRRVQEKEDWAILETIQACAQRGADLVRQVLTFARGAEGLRMPVNLRQIGDDIAHIIQETFPKTLQFKIEIQKDVWPIVGDPTQLHQVFMNLCVNARDAMPTGGLLGMRIENFEVSSDTVSLDASAKPGRYVRVEISDSGTGIPEELQTRIFEPFFTTKEPGLGTGLGLSTTLAIVKSHGGFLQVSSKVGEGSVFRLCFPAEAAVHVDASLEQDTDSDSPGRGEWILFVDDEESIREVARQILENAGYVMVPATHGAEAVTTFAKSREKIALVITDMAMPQMDGPTAIKAIRAIAPEIPIIGSSGVTDHDIMEKARTLSLDCFLGRPYTAQALLAAIRSTLKNRSSGGPHTISLK